MRPRELRPFLGMVAIAFAFVIVGSFIVVGGLALDRELSASPVPGATAHRSQLVLQSDDGLTKIILDANHGGIHLMQWDDDVTAERGDPQQASTMAFRFTGGGDGQLSMRCGDSVANIYSGNHFGGFTVESREKNTLAQLLAMKYPGGSGTCGVLLYDNDNRSSPRAANAALALSDGDTILQSTHDGELRKNVLEVRPVSDLLNTIFDEMAKGLRKGVTVKEPERRDPPLDKQAGLYELDAMLRQGHPYVDRRTPPGMGYVARR